MEKILEALIEPKPKERPRARLAKTKDGKPYVQMYTPSATEKYEETIRKAWIRENGEEPLMGPLVVHLMFGMRIPKSTNKTDRVAMLERRKRPITKPDLDNCAKSVLDALNGIAYKDDNQIVTMYAKKYYTETPCIKIVIANWEKRGGCGHEQKTGRAESD